MCPTPDETRRAHYPCATFPHNPHIQATHEQARDKPKFRHIQQNIPLLFKSVKVKKRPRNGHQLEDIKEMLNKLIWIPKQKTKLKAGKIQTKSAV